MLFRSTKQNEQAANFPNGVPCVSDASMNRWMEYVYMQQPMPTNTTGVPITISVLDANGNYRTIGQTTSDTSGTFAFNWTPDITGEFAIYASFDGSESYYPSSAATHIYTADPPTEPAATEAPQPSMADQYFIPMSTAIIVLIIVVAAVLLLAQRKRP